MAKSACNASNKKTVRRPRQQGPTEGVAAKEVGLKSTADPRVARITLVADGRPPAIIMAESAASPTTLNSFTALNFTKAAFGTSYSIELDASIAVTRAKVARVKAGDLSDIEEALVSNSVALDAIFNEMARRALLNLGSNVDAAETFMRLGLKAQAQNRATLQTLAEMKNPRPVYVQQANIAHGPQQVNNERPANQILGPREAFSSFPSNKLLEVENGERLDPVPSRKTGQSNSSLEALEVFHRS